METRSSRRHPDRRTKGRPPARQADLTASFLAEARRLLEKHYLPRIAQCLKQLGEEDLWWRPNPASNSAGNLTLHLAGNVRQWIVSGLGGKPDLRDRSREFDERGPMPARLLFARLRKAVQEACTVLSGLGSAELHTVYAIQKHRVTGFQAVSHVTDHFAYHSGQIAFITKLRLGQDLGFTRLPGAAAPGPKRRRLSAV